MLTSPRSDGPPSRAPCSQAAQSPRTAPAPPRLRKACIVGGGSSGIAAAKALQDQEVSFDWFEARNTLGGMWSYDPEAEPSPAYNLLRTNTCRDLMAFSDQPLPGHLPDYPHWSHIAAYLDGYLERHQLRRRATLATAVTEVALGAASRYIVTVKDCGTGAVDQRSYDSVVVASGPYHASRSARLPAGLDIPVVTSMGYHKPEPFVGQRVLVVGMGNSGVDISCDLAGVAERVVLSGRGSLTVIPKHLFGVPHDKWIRPLFTRLPWRLQEALLDALYFLARGPLERYRVPVFPGTERGHLPRRRVIASGDLLAQARASRIVIKPQVVGGSGARLIFGDGSEETFDVVISAAGYTTELPFLSEELQRAARCRYRAVIPVDSPKLYFVGILCPRGAFMPLAELQARWVAALHTGRASLPDHAVMKRLAVEELAAQRVDFHPYARELRAELGRSAHPPSRDSSRDGGRCTTA